MREPILMPNGTPAEDEDMSFNYEAMPDGTERRIIDYVMNFTEHFPYWEELPKPKGLIDVEKVDDTWYWIIEDDLTNNKIK